jgi:hypothetical protein
MLVSSFNLLQSFNYTPYLFCKKCFKSEINSFCIWTLIRYLVNNTGDELPALLSGGAEGLGIRRGLAQTLH